MNFRPQTYSFQRYLAAKRTVDDRSLNRHVWNSLHMALSRRNSPSHRLQILEIGGGIGTMVERMMEEGRLPHSTYYLLDEQPENIVLAANRLRSRFDASETIERSQQALPVTASEVFVCRHHGGPAIELHLLGMDLYDFLSIAGPLTQVDLILAHAFMDLVDIPATLPLFTATMQPGALFYFTINFDGITILEPAIDPDFDQLIEQIYHRTMDERVTDGKLSGDSHTGRHMFHHLKAAGIQILDAGSSDWVVLPHHGIYPADESYFLHFIVNTMHGALRNRPEIDSQRLDQWIETRHNQIESGDLVYIAHQLDYLGEYQPATTGASIATSRPSA